jgi:putative ABC transport system substrate-binding protein
LNSRRKLFIALGAALFTPRLVFAQAKKPPVVIGWLHTDSRELSGQYLSVFKEELATLGWKEGSQVVIEEHWADGRIERLQPLAEALAAKKPAIIVAAPSGAVRAAANAAPKTAIVMASANDPVVQGFAKSLARPGGMITGVTSLGGTLPEKYLEFLLAAAPKVKRVGVLIDANAPGRILSEAAVRRSVAQYQVDVRFAEVTRPDEIEPALSRLAKEGAQGLIVTGGMVVRNERQRIAKLALAQGWPVVAGPGGWAEAGALISYSSDILAHYRRAAYYVDRILKGTKPADLPIEQPTRFELVVNLKTAKALSLTMPPEIMVQATRVIQ